jgi:hypothetical protein
MHSRLRFAGMNGRRPRTPPCESISSVNLFCEPQGKWIVAAAASGDNEKPTFSILLLRPVDLDSLRCRLRAGVLLATQSFV